MSWSDAHSGFGKRVSPNIEASNRLKRKHENINPIREDGTLSTETGQVQPCDPRRDRPVRASASMSEDERAPHGSGLYPFSLAFAHAQSRRDIRRVLDNGGCPPYRPHEICRRSFTIPPSRRELGLARGVSRTSRPKRPRTDRERRLSASRRREFSRPEKRMSVISIDIQDCRVHEHRETIHRK